MAMFATDVLRLHGVTRMHRSVQGVDSDGNRWHRLTVTRLAQRCSFCDEGLFKQRTAYTCMEQGDEREICEKHIELEDDDDITGS